MSLAFVTIGIGILSQRAQVQLSRTALGIYDNAFQSMNYLRSAQTIVLGISRDIVAGEKNIAVFVDQAQSALDALEVAHERAMSHRGEALTEQLFIAISEIRAQLKNSAGPPGRDQFHAIEEAFDVAVATYASDGLHLRRSAEVQVARTEFQTYVAIVGSVLTALAITLMLSRTIVPPIRRAVAIASAIASGQLDNRIEGHGTSETWVLLNALAAMQTSIADKIARIESLMAQQASSHGREIASQNARFETALDHMTLGLRMFDSDNNLVVENKRFAEMFASEQVEGEVSVGHPAPALDDEAANAFETGPRACHRALADGRTIAVCEEPMAGGGRVVTYEDVTERQRAEADLSHMVRHDSLTGIPNRVLFREHLSRELEREGCTGKVSLLCLDLDRFKTVNDTLGHPVGDSLLKAAAARLLRTAGEAGLVVRLGGDEFAVVLSTARQEGDSEALAERLVEAFAIPFDVDGHQITIGVSVGIAETSEEIIQADHLLKSADLALYAAKADGRGSYKSFEPEMDACVQERRRMELDLVAALGHRQFELYYQPLLTAGTGTIVAFEALLRWHHPVRGMVPPSEFIPLAEEMGLIPAIGLWVLNRACRDAMTWPDDIKVAVNLSPLQFQYRDLASDVADVLGRSGLHPERLDLEITESLMLTNSEGTLSALHALRAMGIRISMDDFGTGYSSLSYLRQFPFDKIKIDRSFIRDMVGSSDGLAIVKAVIRLGQSLRMNVVAEGVETLEQKALLSEAGCQELQGFLFSKPVPATQVQTLLDHFKLKQAA